MTDQSDRWGAIVRRPGADLASCELSFLDREPVDVARAAEQHAAYVAALRELGVEVTELDPLPGYPDAIYVEDCAVVLDEVAVIARPGAESRRGEIASVAEALSEVRELLRLEDPCTLDGGDVMVVGDTLYIGWSKRTNHAGLKQTAHLLLEHGYMVKAVEVDGCLHMKSAVTSLEDGHLIANRKWVNLERAKGLEVIDVDPAEPFGANVLAVGNAVLCSSAYPRTNAMLAERGYDVRELDLSEFHKMEAATTCPSILYRRL